MKAERPFGDKVRAMRVERNLTLREASSQIGLSAMFLSELESGAKFPSPEKLQNIAEFYHVKKEELETLITKQKIFRELEENPGDDQRLQAARTILSVDNEMLSSIVRILNS
ncbi:MAG: helix-turn-helix transcriptional regulator [Sphaerochaeta sp.]|nr:helix-turn-helix transcriptional regulator [Sphaerochaeta sp.]